MEFTQAFVEHEYNNRALVPDHPEFFSRWERDSEFVRETLPGTFDLAYGPDARHRLDVFPAPRTDRVGLLQPAQLLADAHLLDGDPEGPHRQAPAETRAHQLTYSVRHSHRQRAADHHS